MNDNWFHDFFRGSTLDVWKTAMSHEITVDEATFIANNIGAEEGSHLLDVPCGNGRLSFMLEQMGFAVTGIDTCESFVEEARRLKTVNASNTDFLVGDMRTMKWDRQFAGAFCLGNSFGFFPEAETIKFLKAISDTLTKGGGLIVDTLMVAESFLTNAGQREWQRVGDIYMLIDNSYDCINSIVKSRYTYIRDGGAAAETRIAYYHIFTTGQICRMCESAGLKVTGLFASVDGEEYEVGSPRLLLVARKRS